MNSRKAVRRAPLGWWAPASRWRVVGFVSEADEIPADLPLRSIVIAGTATHPKWLAFDCPCGHDRVMVNASPRRRPLWTIGNHFWAGATLTPSIDSHHDGERCHYVIRSGRILWAANSQRRRADEH